MTKQEIELLDSALSELQELENVCPDILTTDCYLRAIKLLGRLALTLKVEEEEKE